LDGLQHWLTAARATGRPPAWLARGPDASRRLTQSLLTTAASLATREGRHRPFDIVDEATSAIAHERRLQWQQLDRRTRGVDDAPGM
jgi:plasmid stabilization system protein ParE